MDTSKPKCNRGRIKGKRLESHHEELVVDYSKMMLELKQFEEFETETVK